tara:strand:+ start:1159 stop:1887 length:729 start_codon:yes stop_codon:yes gene_type:complete
MDEEAAIMKTSRSLIATIGLTLVVGFSPALAASECDVRQAQQALDERGIDTGPIDGVFGPRTQRAVQQFQTQNDLTASGTLDGDTCQALLAPEQAEAAKAEAAAAEAAAAEAAKAEAAAADKAESAQQEQGSSAQADKSSAKQAATVVLIKPKQPTNPLTIYRTAFGLLKGGVLEPAAKMFEQFLVDNPAHDRVPDAYYWLGDAYAALGKNALARDVWTKIMAAFPEHRYALKAEERLKDLP